MRCEQHRRAPPQGRAGERGTPREPTAAHRRLQRLRHRQRPPVPAADNAPEDPRFGPPPNAPTKPAGLPRVRARSERQCPGRDRTPRIRHYEHQHGNWTPARQRVASSGPDSTLRIQARVEVSAFAWTEQHARSQADPLAGCPLEVPVPPHRPRTSRTRAPGGVARAGGNPPSTHRLGPSRGVPFRGMLRREMQPNQEEVT